MREKERERLVYVSINEVNIERAYPIPVWLSHSSK